MQRIDLKKHGSRAVIGSAGDIVLTGHGVMRRHAELTPAGDGGADLVVRPLQGEVWVERGPALTVVWGEFLLADGDVVVIGSHRMLYHNVAATWSGCSEEELIRWLS